MANVIKLYVPYFVGIQIQTYYAYLVRATPLGRVINQEKILELESIKNTFSPQTILDIKLMTFGKRLRRKLIDMVA